MLALTRPHRQVLATLGLLAFTVLPTGYIASTAWRINRPGHVRDVEIEVGRQLGLLVTMEGVRYPRPGEVIYRGVTLRQEDGRKQSRLTEIARAEVVRLRHDDRELMLEVEALQLRGDDPKGAMAQVAALLQRATGAAFDRI